jgi:hypothetical protein
VGALAWWRKRITRFSLAARRGDYLMDSRYQSTGNTIVQLFRVRTSVSIPSAGTTNLVRPWRAIFDEGGHFAAWEHGFSLTSSEGRSDRGASNISQSVSWINLEGETMKRFAVLLVTLIAAGVIASSTPVSGHADEEASPIYGITIPPGYRDWKLISVAHEEGNLNDLRAQLGNDIAIRAYREGTIPFPDGSIIAAMHWKYLASEENNKAFGRPQSFVAGPPKNMQFMVKDSKKYAATGGWGFADFTDGKPADEATHSKCFSCHEPLKAHDFVFTHYAP